MAPCTRQARKARNPSHTSMGLNNTVFGDPTHASAVDHVGDEGQPLANTTQSQTNAIGKRTFSTYGGNSSETTTSPPEERPTPIKRARAKARIASVNTPSRLVQLMGGEQITGQMPTREDEGQQREGQQRAVLQRKASFYPGLNGIDSILDVQTDDLADILPDEAHFEDEDDWFGIPSVSELSRGPTSKFSEAVAKERPTWDESSSTSGLHEPTSIILGGDKGPVAAATSLGQAIAPMVGMFSLASETAGPAEIPAVILPPTIRHTQDGVPLSAGTNSDLCFVPGTNRILLNSQLPIVNRIIVDAIENIRVSLLFLDAFPDAARAAEFIRDGLLTGAARQGPAAATIHARLREEEHYLSAITPLPRARISIFRAEVKERCNVITAATFLAMPSPEVIQSVYHQLSNYNYTFPKAPRNVGNGNLVMHSRPYRNPRIIAVIRDLYFTGGHTSFACRFRYLFPQMELDNVVKYEVPVPMVALVATALYAVIYEWRTGKQQTADFTTNSYLDVYKGHVNTMNEIRTKRKGAFHSMMADIYLQASTASVDPVPGPSTMINFEDLED